MQILHIWVVTIVILAVSITVSITRETLIYLQDTPPFCVVLPCSTSQPFLDDDDDDDDDDDNDIDKEEETPRRLKPDEQHCKQETKPDRPLMPIGVVMN